MNILHEPFVCVNCRKRYAIPGASRCEKCDVIPIENRKERKRRAPRLDMRDWQRPLDSDRRS